MAYTRQPTADPAPTGTDYLKVLGDGFSANNYTSMYIKSTSGSIQSTSIAGGSAGNYRTNVHTFTGLQPNTSYGYWVEYYNPSTGNNESTGTSYFTTLSAPVDPNPPANVVTTISNVTGTSLKINWSGGSGSDSFVVALREIWESGTITYFNTDISSGTTSVTITGLKEYFTYTAKVYGNNTAGAGTGSWVSDMTLDATAPTVSIVSSDGNGRVYFDFSGNDVAPTSGNMSGLFYYDVWISAPNSSVLPTAYHSRIYDLNLSYFTFETDRYGANFVHNSQYTIGVKAVDLQGNVSTMKTATVTFLKVRPSNWNWLTPKVSGNPINITAVEWESLGKAINLFRTYKNLIVINFPVPTIHQTITASLYNQYRNAINDMSPPTTVPSLKTANVSLMYASDFNGLTASLNSIT